MTEKDNQNNGHPTSVGSFLPPQFLDQRKVFLWGEVNEESAKDLVAKFLYLEAINPGEPITFYIDTPGGIVTSGMAIYDTIKLISSSVTVIVTGMAASMGSILLSAADKGNRYLFPNAHVLIHQPLTSGQMVAPAVDINIWPQEMERTREKMNEILSEASGQSLEKIIQDTDRTFTLTATEAIEYGLADKIINKV